MTVVEYLPLRIGRRHEFRAGDDGVEPTLQEGDEVLARVARAAHRLLVVFAELLLADIGVIAFQLLLRHELGAEVRGLAAALAVLAGRIIAAVDGALRTAPQIDRKSTRLNSSHYCASRMPPSA